MIGDEYCETVEDRNIEKIIEEIESRDVGKKPDKTLGIKHDAEKLRWSLLPLREIEEVIKVLMHGSKKYADNNWMRVKPKERYIDAAFRHLAARAKGEILDDESKLPHLAHCVCCLLFLLFFDKQDNANE